MAEPVYSVVMPTASDYEGVWMTVQALRMYHDCTDVEFVIADNKPNSPAGKRLRTEVAGKRYQHCRYIETPDPEGTAPTKERAIQEARGRYVLCMDSHVMLAPGVLDKLKAYWRENPDSSDLISGPMIYDTLETFETHLNPVWRGEMFGIWGKAWELNGQRFSVIENGDKARFVRLDAGTQLVDVGLPQMDYANHATALVNRGARLLGQEGDVFEIPGMGCGLMAFRKAAWPGFNPQFRGFGGEELYIQEKFRRNGGKALCLGFLRWLHRFGRPNGVPYRLTNDDKCRNYVIGHTELGMDLAPIREHFVDAGKVSAEAFEKFVSNPEAVPPAPPARPVAKDFGPGTQLKQLLASMGIEPNEKCGCNKVAFAMDQLGVEGCRKRRDFFRDAILSKYESWGWRDKFNLYAAGAMSVVTGGVAWQMKDKSDPVGSMIDLAIEREENRLAEAVAS